MARTVYFSFFENSFLSTPLNPLGFLASSVSFWRSWRRFFLLASSSIGVENSRLGDSRLERSLTSSLGRSLLACSRREPSLFTEPSASRRRRRRRRASSSPARDFESASESLGVRVASSVPEPRAEAGGVGSARCEELARCFGGSSGRSFPEWLWRRDLWR